MELIVSDTSGGFYLVRENKPNYEYVTDLSKFATDSQKMYEPFGKIQFMALNSRKD